jgi:hypothetical protein
MFTIAFSILVPMATLGTCSGILLRIRLTKAEPADKFVWWRRGDDEIADGTRS